MAKIYLPPGAKHSGIDITYQQKKNVLIIGGWYDGFVGIEPTLMPLAEFFKQLGITRADCERAFAEQPASDGGEGA